MEVISPSSDSCGRTQTGCPRITWIPDIPDLGISYHSRIIAPLSRRPPSVVAASLLPTGLLFGCASPSTYPLFPSPTLGLINQDNIPEKVRQIGQMTTIYSRADKVNAWLGHADEELEGLEETFAKLRNFRQDGSSESLRPYGFSLLFDLMRMWVEEVAV